MLPLGVKVSIRDGLNIQRFFRFIFVIALVAMVAFPACHAAAPAAPDPNPTLVFKQFAAGKAIHFVAYGDMRFTDPAVTEGTNPRVRGWLADHIAEVAPQVILLTGDMPFTGSSPADWEEFQKETSGWKQHGALQLPTVGNHEIKGDVESGIANYLKNFPAIEGHRYYSATLGNVEVISLDMTLPGTAAGPQARWFGAQLDHLPPQIDFLFILYHIPWVADPQTRLVARVPTPGAVVLRRLLEERLNRIRARVVVFNGHIHNYERFERLGVEYVVTGGGGAEPYPILLRGRADLYRDTAFPVYHYLTVDVQGRELHAVMWKVKAPLAPELSVEKKDEFRIAAPEADSAHVPAGRH